MVPFLMLAAMLSLSGVAAAQEPSAVPIADTTEQQVWRGTPIRVDLRLNTERTVRVPGASQLRSGLLGGPVPGLRVQTLGDHLYLKAEQPFAATRLIVQPDAGPSILLDLAADHRFPAGAPLEVLTNPASATGREAEPTSLTPQAINRPVGYVALVRHAAQSLYAPTRLSPRSATIARAPLPFHGAIDLVRGGHIEAQPVAAWRAKGPRGPLWLAAIKLRNTLTRPVTLDPRDLRGQWRAASFQHARLGATGDPTDTTTVYLVADQRPAAALAPFVPKQAEVAR
ncbi:MAG: TIGR03749 family integrating conjugative element protein [Chromatiaceae bacterium]|nr:TIGR03749 family integrating conjugative element protein [Rhodoferax sp.]MCP5414903.1 TIGR03749 family integrating conjugative element protein [Chromatiaceae bacterium]